MTSYIQTVSVIYTNTYNSLLFYQQSNIASLQTPQAFDSLPPRDLRMKGALEPLPWRF